MKIPSIILLSVVCLFASSCSRHDEKEAMQRSAGEQQSPTSQKDSTTAPEEDESQPDSDQIGEDCVGFVRATRTVSGDGKNSECPECPAQGNEVLKFEAAKVERVSPSGPGCEVDVAIRATFNPSTSREITGGLVGWIPAEQRTQYLRGLIPSGQQVYHVTITYRREGDEWQAVEFERR